ncbi:hypothetical protein [Dialister micraerophilus]|uniref:hypothetical protein n=1 Tax=Dialister micraerophilus TaxID=309120 RepID=UPI0023F116A5|nr:hypothetical protein [Dialister micraerophilus]
MIKLFQHIIYSGDVRVWGMVLGFIFFTKGVIVHFSKQKDYKLLRFIIEIPSIILVLLGSLMAFLGMLNIISKKYAFLGVFIWGLAGLAAAISFYLKLKKYSYIFIENEEKRKSIKKYIIIYLVASIFYIFIYFLFNKNFE